MAGWVQECSGRRKVRRGGRQSRRVLAIRGGNVGMCFWLSVLICAGCIQRAADQVHDDVIVCGPAPEEKVVRHLRVVVTITAHRILSLW